MAIFRGTGGAGSGDNDATITAITTKATEAATSATAASGSASSAASSATASANSASTATTKASEASTSKDTATTKASEASTSATAAANSATAAAASAADIGQDIATSDSPTFAGLTINGAIVATSTVDGRDLQTDGSKLDGIEASATADQSNAEIRTAVEAATDSNVFTDADHSKLNAIEASATADQTDAQIRTAVEAASDSNVFTDADHTKLNGVAASSNNYVHPNHSGEVTSTADGATVIANAIVDEANLKISNAPTNGYFLSAQSGDTGGMTWAVPANTTYSVGDGGLTTHDFTDADHTKLNAIEASADVTDATNVTAAGALMDSELAGIAAIKATTGTFLSADESKLDGIAASANNYVHPNHSGEVTSTADGATVIADNIVDEANLKVSNAPTNGYMLTAQSGDTGGLTWAAAGAGGGKVLQIVNVQTGAVATGTTTMPNDDTIAQNTEGDEYMTLAITPTSATSRLRIDVVIQTAHTSTSYQQAAIFQDSTASAIAVGTFGYLPANSFYHISFNHNMVAGTTSETTFKVRSGAQISGTTTFNGRSSARAQGGVQASSITIMEYTP